MEKNAEALVAAGAARMIRQDQLDAARLTDELRDLLNDPERQAAMAANCRCVNETDRRPNTRKPRCN